MLLLEDKLAQIKDAIDFGTVFGWNLDDDDQDCAIESMDDCLYNAGIRNFEVDCGVSKMVIIPRDSAYVLKTPLFGSFYYPEYYNEDEEEWTYDYDNAEFEEYTGAYFEGADIDCSNYCELEEYLYNCAVEEGVAHMLAKTEFFAYAKHNRPVYLSEKCIPLYWKDRAPSESSKTLVKEKRDSNTPGWSKMNSGATALFVDHYGAEDAEKLFNFLVKYHIHDLHSGNVMISQATNKIVISDYSGFEH